MIAKRLREGKDGKGCVLHLVKYITARHGKSHRVGEVFITNCISETPMMAAREMLAKQMLNTRAKSGKTYHLLISFKPGEEPDKEILGKIEAALCAKLGFGQHQRIAVIHHDTDHMHMHVAINKIHPTKLTIHNPYYDFDALAKTCMEIEETLGLTKTNHEPAGKTRGERQAKDIEALTGNESLHTWIHREVFEKLRKAESWTALHGELAKAGLTLSLRGAGVVVASNSGHRITGSKLHRSFSKANLEMRLGPFQPKPEWCAGVKPEKEYLWASNSPADPLREEYEKLREARDKAKKERLDLIGLNCTRKKELILAENAADKARARATRMGRHQKRLLYATIHGKYRSQLDLLHAETKRAKKEVYAECRSQAWVQWLQEQAQMGRVEAIEALRKRAFSLAKANGAALRGEAATAPGIMPGEKIDGVTKRGTIIYDLGADAVRDDGKSFRVGNGATRDTDIMALKLAQRRFGNVIHVDGGRAFQERMVRAAVEGKVFIKFADPYMERRRNEMFRARYQERKERENEERQQVERELGNTFTSTGRTAPLSRSPIANDTRNPIRSDGHAAKERQKNEPGREQPGGRGASR